MSRPRGGIIGKRVMPGASMSGIWTLREAQEQVASQEWPQFYDADIASVSLLLHFAGSNGSQTITDTSNSPKTLSRFGNAAISTGVSKFGGSSLYLDGTGDYLNGSSSGYAFEAGDFTVECWAYTTESPATADNGLFQIGNSLTAPNLSGVAVALSNVPVIYSGDAQTNGTSAVLINTWHHYAMVRSGSTLKLYFDGQEEISVTNSSNLTSQNLLLGAYYSTTFPWQGYIDDFRITKGVARYTANFTPPNAPFPDQ